MLTNNFKPIALRSVWVLGMILGLGQTLGQNPRVRFLELHDKSLHLTEWARQPMLLNPVAPSFDYEGRLCCRDRSPWHGGY